MCYAALTKGLTAISTELLIAAHRLNLDTELWQEISTSQKELLEYLNRQIPTMLPKAHRWVGEMEELENLNDHSHFSGQSPIRTSSRI
jgi:hypothetical protein